MSGDHREWHWEITTRCNLNCLHCLNNCGKPGRNELTLNGIKKAIKTMAGLGCKNLMITGGEPLALKNLLIILNDCREEGINIQLLTNGFTVDHSLVQQLVKVVEAVGVSLDGSKPEINDFIRGRHSFERACQAIKIFVDYLPVSVYFTVSKINVNDMECVIKLAWSLGTNRVHISEITMAGRALNYQKLLQITEQQKSYLQQFAKDTTGGNLSKPEDRCSADLSVLYLTSNGMVYPCTEVALRRPLSAIGHINNPEFREKLQESRGNFVNNPRLRCCYQIYTGNNLVFCLNKVIPCPLTKKARCRND